MAFLIIMNLAGMYLNLWGNIPDFSSAAKAFGSIPLLDAHVAFAIAIAGNVALFTIRAIRPPGRQFRPIATMAIGFAALAIFSGVEFTFNGGNDVFSMTMEIGFIGLVAVNAYVLFAVGRMRRAAGP